jgi:hypothetical protein
MIPLKTPISLLIAAVAFWLVCTARAATGTPEYRVIRAVEKFEIRDYPELTIATTPMKEEGMNNGFRELFRFISGENGRSEKIEMTAPVLIDSVKDGKTMSFIMPQKAVEKGVPAPAGEKVKLGKVEAARVAVLRFSGSRVAENEKAAIEKLTAWLEKQKIPQKGEPTFAYYDPPWTPAFMRRNEVMVRIDKQHE